MPTLKTVPSARPRSSRRRTSACVVGSAERAGRLDRDVHRRRAISTCSARRRGPRVGARVPAGIARRRRGSMTLPTPQPGNGSANGQARCRSSTIVRVAAAPRSGRRVAVAKPRVAVVASTTRPSRRVTLVAVDVHRERRSSSGMLPPPWTTVRPPCGPGTKTLRVVAAGSSAARRRGAASASCRSAEIAEQAPASRSMPLDHARAGRDEAAVAQSAVGAGDEPPSRRRRS